MCWIPTLPTLFAPGSARVLETMQRALAYRGPPQESREASSPLTSCQFSFLGWVGKGPRRVASHPPHPGGGGEQSRARAEVNLYSPWPQCSKSALAAAGAAAAARAAWGGDRASPRLRSAGDLNATETVIHHRRSR